MIAGKTKLATMPAAVPPSVISSGMMKCSKSTNVATMSSETKIQYAMAMSHGKLIQTARKRRAVSNSTAK